MRAGELSLDRLRLAAYLGDAAAEAALAGAPSMVAGVDAAPLEVADDAAFARVLGAERAVGVVHFPWSGYCHMSRRRFREVLAPVLRGLAPDTDVSLFVLLLDDFPRTETGAFLPARCHEWVAEMQQVPTGAGEILWLRSGSLVRKEYPGAVAQPLEFVRATVEALSLVLDDVT